MFSFIYLKGKYRNVKVLLLAGGDLIESFKNPGLWLDDDVCMLIIHFIRTA
jgi:hypothetical protein